MFENNEVELLLVEEENIIDELGESGAEEFKLLFKLGLIFGFKLEFI